MELQIVQQNHRISGCNFWALGGGKMIMCDDIVIVLSKLSFSMLTLNYVTSLFSSSQKTFKAPIMGSHILHPLPRFLNFQIFWASNFKLKISRPIGHSSKDVDFYLLNISNKWINFAVKIFFLE